METLALGTLTLFALAAAYCCISCKKPVPGIICSIAAVILIVLSGYSWRTMLSDSGKDTALLGFAGYPAVPMILAVLLLCSAAALITSVILAARKRS